MNNDFSKSPVILSYGVAVLSVVFSTVILLWIKPDLGTAVYVSLFLCAVMFSAWFGGLGPGFLATILAVLALEYCFLPPTNSFAVENTYLPRLLFFSFFALVVVSLIGLQKRSSELLRRSEETLRRSKAQLQLVINTIPALVWTAQPDGSLDFINQVHQEFTGLSLDDVGDWRWTAVIHPEDNARLVGQWRAALAAGEPLEAEARLRRVHGDYRWLLIRAVPLSDESGKIVKWYGTKTDITERKEAEEKLSAREGDLKTIFAILPAGISILDKEGKIIEMNPALQTILGMSTQGLLEGHYVRRKYLRADGTPMPVEEFPSSRAIKEQRQIPDTEIGVVKEDGAIAWTIVSAAPLPGSRSVAVTADITARKNAEIALRTSEALLSNALEIAHLGPWEYDVSKDLFTFNDQFYKLLRTTAEKEGGYTMSSKQYAERFVHPDERSVVGKEIEAAIKSDDPHFSRELEHRIISADGEVGFIAVRFFVVKDSERRTIKTYGVNQDITKRKQGEEGLRKFFRATEQSPDNVFITNKAGIIEYVNGAFVELTGYDKEKAIGSTPRIVKSGAHDQEFYNNLWETIN